MKKFDLPKLTPALLRKIRDNKGKSASKFSISGHVKERAYVKPITLRRADYEKAHKQ